MHQFETNISCRWWWFSAAEIHLWGVGGCGTEVFHLSGFLLRNAETFADVSKFIGRW